MTDALAILPLQYAPLIALALSLALIPLAAKLARAGGLVDHPGGRKDHAKPTPLVGGLVIFPVYIIIAGLAGIPLDFYWPLFAGILLILIVGALDDRYEIAAWVKFLAQLSAATLIVVIGDAEVRDLGDLFGFGPVDLGWFSIPFSIFTVALLINAINLMDGLDGLAGGKSLVIVGWFMAACALAGHWPPFFTLGILAGALAGFLYYNLRHPLRDKASVFLGDAGSMALGLTLSWYAIGLAQPPDPTLAQISVAWILALPVIDACGQFLRRISEGRHPFSADRGHFHHHLVHAGVPIGRSTALILLLGVVLGGIGIGGIALGIPAFILSYLWIALLISHVAVSYQPARYVNLISKFRKSAAQTTR